jgi:alpha-tubulin suppressor-like RCC1 family protein
MTPFSSAILRSRVPLAIFAGGLTILLTIALGAQAPAPAPGIRHVASRDFTLVVRGDGSVVGWGRDADGKAARPTSPKRVITTPVVLELPGKALQVAVGYSSQYALLEDGTVVAWGANDQGQLGNGPMGSSAEPGRYPKPSITPVRVTGLTGIVQIATGLKHAVALKNDGTVWAWGDGDNGEIGDGEQPKGRQSRSAIGPVRVPGLERITQIAADAEHSLALRSDGRVLAWGQNRNGELGNGTRVTGWTRTEVTGIDRVVSIAAGTGGAGAGVSGAVRDDGTVWMWGSNTSGQMGNGLGPLSPDDEGGRVLTPIPVKGVTGAKRISIGFGHVGALLADGTLRMWGHDGWGQTGVGTSGHYSLKPVKPAHANVAAIFLGGFHSFAVGQDGSLWTWGGSFFEGGPGFLGRIHKVPTRLDLD